MDLDGFRVVVDYAHNPPALEALGTFVDLLAEPSPGGARPLVTGDRIAVVATAGDRRDQDIRELGATAARHFDRIVVREDDHLRGRQPGETAALIEEGIRAAMEKGARCREVRTILDEMDATRAALDAGRPGDVVTVCVDHANAVWKELQRRQHGASSLDGPMAAEARP